MTDPRYPRYAEARALVYGAQKASASFIQRTMRIGYNEAAKYVELMEREGFISAANNCGIRKVLGADLPQLANDWPDAPLPDQQLANGGACS